MLKLQRDETNLVLTNRQKLFWPGEGYTKGDLLDYHREIAPVLVPHLKDRPQIMHQHVDGQKADGKEFFQRISRAFYGRRPAPILHSYPALNCDGVVPVILRKARVNALWS